MSIDSSSLSCSSSESMLSKCFERIFCELQVQVIAIYSINLRLLVTFSLFCSLYRQAWNKLSNCGTHLPSPALILTRLQSPYYSCITQLCLGWWQHLLGKDLKNFHMTWKSYLFVFRNPNVTLCTWTLAFQCLTLVANQPKTEDWRVNNIIDDPSFLKMLRKFLTGNGVPNHVILQKLYFKLFFLK